MTYEDMLIPLFIDLSMQELHW